ncbi:very low-density lipoprotein receptor-like isoform X6 [Eriocheir sinensis]|uniref:very low-density lipoprotein receptor-like isoform X6 n=1 Tax=Eriocheir sinensis TaxID=95602 RepID=UPI0021CA0C93|nr:very low-density lipoprotein receptor-like isoform X6 [Eriocheir sinensis]
MPPLRSLVVVLLLAASLAHSLPQDDPSRNLDFTFADKTRVLASRVSGRDLTRPRRQSSSSRLVDYQGGSGKLEYKDERDMDEPGTDSVRFTLKKRGVGCPWDDYHMCQSGSIICGVHVCDAKVDCPDGDDEQDCAGPAFDISERSCPGDSTYTCVSGDTICRVNICDGNKDCPDGDDEQDCECSADQFLCDKTKCIPNTWLCDGDEDCEDKTDEQDCSGCGAGQWQCRDGGCISEKDRCDGCVHCRDGSDEEGCRPKRCRHWEFRCRDGSCINKRLRCNGRRDCRDGSDEWQCRPHWPWHHGRNRFTEADPNLREEALL